MAPRLRILAIATVAALLVGACGGGDEPAAQDAGGPSMLEAQQLTALDQQITYPKRKPAQISSAIVQLEPGQESGWMRHRVPVFVYVMEGTLSIEYEAGVTKTFTAGTTFVQAQGVDYNASNTGEGVTRVLQVFMGAEGVRNTTTSP